MTQPQITISKQGSLSKEGLLAAVLSLSLDASGMIVYTVIQNG